jgi:hypothetical protein
MHALDVQGNEMLKSVIRIAAIAGIAGAIMSFTPVAPMANGAGAPAEPAFAKGDRLPTLVKGAACAQRAWPNYEPGCLFDKRRLADEVRKISVISLDRRDMQSPGPVLEVASR